LGAGAIAVSGCVSTEPPPVVTIAEPPPAPAPVVPPMYYAMPNERFPIPEVDISQLPPQFWRTEVDYPTKEKPGTLVVDTPAKYLYRVKADGRAMRYGIGVGRDGFAWAGEAIM